jgi:hypothetical protein
MKDRRPPLRPTAQKGSGRPSAICFQCGRPYEAKIGEASHFIRDRVDPIHAAYLKFCFPMTLECLTPGLQAMQTEVRSLNQYILCLCPYCREVILGRPDGDWMSDFSGKIKGTPSGFQVER